MQRGWLLVAALLGAVDACADVSGSASVLSDYRYRGYSLSNDRPVAQAGLAYDHDSGLYEGAMISGARFGDDTGWEKQLMGYLGFASRFESGLAWEAGASHVSFTSSHDYNYDEYYAGLSGRELSARVYYSPNYYQQGRGSLYGELNGTRHLVGPLSLQAHAGVLRLDPFARAAAELRATQFDVRLGLEWALPDVSVGLAWSDGSKRPLFLESPDAYGAGSAFQLTVSHTF